MTNVDGLGKCFQDKFAQYHRQLTKSESGTQIRDAYGFLYPHDYPLEDGSEAGGEGPVHPQWEAHIPEVLAKYERRIERFLKIMDDHSKPLLVLCRYKTFDETRRLYQSLCDTWQRTDIYMLNAGNFGSNHPRIFTCFPESNDIWNNAEVWREAVDCVVSLMLKRDPVAPIATPLGLKDE